METRRKMKLGTSDKVILGVGYTLLGLFVLAVFVPLVYVVLASFMDPNVLNNQGLSFNFKDWTLDAYRRVLENDMIWRGFANSFFYSAGFTVISVLVTLLAAYPMSKKEFVGRNFFNVIFVITMFFGGGDDPHVHPDQQPAHGQYDLGDPPSGRVQRVEHDPRKDLFPVDPGRTQRGVLAGRGERDPAFL